VTGGAGFIGAHLVAALVAAGEEVIVLDNLSRRELDRTGELRLAGSVRLVVADVRSREAVARAMEDVTHVYHLAALSSVRLAMTDPDSCFATNVLGTYHVLAAAEAAGVERVVFSSSREVYGEACDLPVAEDRQANPKNMYGASKAAAEVYCRAFGRMAKVDVSVLRLCNVYGVGDRDRLIPTWLDRARRGEDLVAYGGKQILDFVPVEVVVAALLNAATTRLQGRPINIGTGVGTSLPALAERVRDLTGVRVGLRILPPRPEDVTRFVANVSRMHSMLGIAPPQDPLCALGQLWHSV